MSETHHGQSIGRLLSTSLAVACLALLAGCYFDKDDDDDESVACTSSGNIWGAGAEGLVNGCQAASRFNNPANVEVASDGTVYVADYDNDAVRAIAADGTVSTLVSPATVPPPLTFSRPFGLTVSISPSNNFLYVQTDGNDTGMRDATTGTIWRVDRGTGMASVVARDLGRPRGLQALPDGRIAMSDPEHHVITLIDPAAVVPTETLLAGANDTPAFLNAIGAAARFDRPYGLALLDADTLIVADQNNNRLRQIIISTGVVTTFAGTGAEGSSPGTTTTATFNHPQDVTIAGANVYVSDHDNFLIRRIKAGAVTTEAGNGVQGFVDATGTSASFFGLEGIAVTADGTTLWIADGDNGDDLNFNRVRRLTVVP